MEMGSFGLLKEFRYVVPCLLIYLNVNYKAGFPFLSFRAPPGLLRINNSFAYPRGAGTVGNDCFFLMHASLVDSEGSRCTDQEGHQHHRESLSQGRGGGGGRRTTWG